MDRSQLGLDFTSPQPKSATDTASFIRAAISEAQEPYGGEQADPGSVPSPEGVRSEPPLLGEVRHETVLPKDASASGLVVPPLEAADLMDPTEGARLFESKPDPSVLVSSLLDEYKIPPFTILDTRQGYWQERRRLWLGLNIKSEIGRDAKLTFGKFNQDYGSRTQALWANATEEERVKLSKETYLDPHIIDKYGDGSTSVFDPLLCEIVYRWLCPPGGAVLDPFAGGSVRGIVAACLGHPYLGIELRGIQVEANKQQAHDIIREEAVSPSGELVPPPLWIQGDSDTVLAAPGLPKADLMFTCPPYADLEVYSDDPADLSKMKPDEFDDAYRRILRRSVEHLNPDRFAVVVIGNIRDKAGRVRDLVGLTNSAMAAAGAYLYNEAILLNVSGTGAIRARKQFDTSRKLVRVHQCVQIYATGDPRKAAAAINV